MPPRRARPPLATARKSKRHCAAGREAVLETVELDLLSPRPCSCPAFMCARVDVFEIDLQGKRVTLRHADGTKSAWTTAAAASPPTTLVHWLDQSLSKALHELTSAVPTTSRRGEPPNPCLRHHWSRWRRRAFSWRAALPRMWPTCARRTQRQFRQCVPEAGAWLVEPAGRATCVHAATTGGDAGPLPVRRTASGAGRLEGRRAGVQSISTPPKVKQWVPTSAPRRLRGCPRRRFHLALQDGRGSIWEFPCSATRRPVGARTSASFAAAMPQLDGGTA